jgi:hypothetical protein
MLSDERAVVIVETPPAHEAAQRITLPPFQLVRVEGPDDPRWAQLDWPENHRIIASSAEMENGTLTIYYSTVFPKYADQRAALERRDAARANSFTQRYEIWLAVHSLLLHHGQQETTTGEAQRQKAESFPEWEENREREERCRIATLAALFAAREVTQPGDAENGD